MPARLFNRETTGAVRMPTATRRYTAVVTPHDVQIWFRATDALDAAAIAAATSVLSDEERAQYHRFHVAHDARDYAAAHALLRHALSATGDHAPAQWRFDKTAAGKPLLIGNGADRASFSLSHTRGMVACAVTSGAAIGLDVECIDRRVDAGAIAARFFAPAETAQISALDGEARRDRFFDLWTSTPTPGNSRCLRQARVIGSPWPSAGRPHTQPSSSSDLARTGREARGYNPRSGATHVYSHIARPLARLHPARRGSHAGGL
jgi:4'-phosphopantetheinyl transferase EntD